MKRKPHAVTGSPNQQLSYPPGAAVQVCACLNAPVSGIMIYADVPQRNGFDVETEQTWTVISEHGYAYRAGAVRVDTMTLYDDRYIQYGCIYIGKAGPGK